MNSTIRTGFFVFVALVALAIVVSVVEDVDVFKSGDLYYTYFPHVSGLEIGSRVRMVGVVVGRIEDLEILDDCVKVEMRIDDGLPLKESTRAEIRMMSIMGNAVIYLTLGEPGDGPLEGDQIQSVRKKDFQEIVDSAAGLLDGAGSVMPAIDDALKDVRKLVNDLNETQAKLSAKLDEALEKYEGKLDGIVANIETTTENAKEITENVKVMSGRMDQIVAHVQKGEGTVGKVLMEEELYEEIMAISQMAQDLEKQVNEMLEDNRGDIDLFIDQANNAALKMQKALDSANAILDKVEQGEGTVGKLVADDKLYTQVTSGLEEVQDFFGKTQQLKIYLGVSGMLDSSAPDGVNAEAYLRLEPTDSKYYYLGVSNIAAENLDEDEEDDEQYKDEELEFDALIAARFWDRFVFKGGLINTTPGIGLDYTVPLLAEEREFWRNPTIKAELYDIGDAGGPAVDLRLHWPVWEYFYLYGEAHDIFDDGEWRGGVGFEFRDEDIKYVVGIVGSAL